MAFKGDSIFWVEVEKVVPNPFQPRREFDQTKLAELGESIRMYGVLQPLTVTRKEVQHDDGTFNTEYELIAGERRLRASKLAGVAQVPVIIREGEQSEQEKLELAIIENLQREDLNAVDRAIAFKQLTEQFNLSHSQVSKKMGRSREYVSNSIRLLGLPKHMLESLGQGKMMEGHARTLLMLTDRPAEQEVVYKEILLKKLSVREVERIVRKIATDKVRKRKLTEADLGLIEFEKKFTETLGTRVQILKTDFGGKLTIDYFSEDDLEGILKRMHEDVAEGKDNDSVMAAKISSDTALNIASEPKVEVPKVTAVESSHTPVSSVASAPVSAPLSTPPPVSTSELSPAPTQPHSPDVSGPEPEVSPVMAAELPPQTESIPETLIDNHSVEVVEDKPVSSMFHSEPVQDKVEQSTVLPIPSPIQSSPAPVTSLAPVSEVRSEPVLPKQSSEPVVPTQPPSYQKPVVENNVHSSQSPAQSEVKAEDSLLHRENNPISEPVEKPLFQQKESEQVVREAAEETFVQVPPAAPVVATQPTVPEKKPEEKDDTDLYSISNFSI